MSNSNRKNKTISFNSLDEHDMSLLEHAERINPLTGKPRNFSKYVKRLIEDDMKRGKQFQSGNAITVDRNETVLKEPDAYSIEVKDAMSSFL